MKLFRRTFALLLPFRLDVAIGLACVCVAALLTLWMPRLLGGAIDLVGELAAGDGNADGQGALLSAALLILAVGASEAALKFVARRKIIEASRRAEEALKNQLVQHIAALPVGWFDRARTGDLISRLTQDVELLRFVIGPTVLHGGAALLIVPGGIYLMADLSWVVFATGLVVFTALVVSMVFLLPRMHEHSKAVQEAIAEISQRCSEDFSGIRVLMTFGRAPAEVRTMATMCEAYVEHNVRLGRVRAWLNALIHSSRELVVLGVVVLGGMEVMNGNLTVGELFQFLILVGVMVWPLIALSWVLGTLNRARAAAERVEEVFAAEPEAQQGEAPSLRGQLVVDHLTFTYDGATRPALRDVSLTLEPGQKLGLIGPIGSGKSTLLGLILRLYEPPRGAIFVDGIDVLDIQPAALRRAFGVAPQDPFLFSDSIRGNVVFGTAAGDDDVDRAIHTSALDQDLESYPEGLDSVVGERGLTLSGGQKQRVSLARALAADRSTLLLDDTLSAIDHRTEARILERLRSARNGRTTVVATHRVSAVADADLIVVLEDGAVREAGSPQELLARGGYYAQAWARQREHDAFDAPEEA